MPPLIQAFRGKQVKFVKLAAVFSMYQHGCDVAIIFCIMRGQLSKVSGDEVMPPEAKSLVFNLKEHLKLKTTADRCFKFPGCLLELSSKEITCDKYPHVRMGWRWTGIVSFVDENRTICGKNTVEELSQVNRPGHSTEAELRADTSL